MSQKYNRSIVILPRTLVWIFGKSFMKTLKKKHSFHNKLYIRVTDILKFYEVLFCTYCKGFFIFKKQSLSLYYSIYA